MHQKGRSARNPCVLSFLTWASTMRSASRIFSSVAVKMNLLPSCCLCHTDHQWGALLHMYKYTIYFWILQSQWYVSAMLFRPFSVCHIKSSTGVFSTVQLLKNCSDTRVWYSLDWRDCWLFSQIITKDCCHDLLAVLSFHWTLSIVLWARRLDQCGLCTDLCWW